MAAAVYLPLLQLDPPADSTASTLNAESATTAGAGVLEHSGLNQVNRDKVRHEVERVGKLWQE